MESAIDTTVYEKELTIDARPETVWEFLVDSEKATRWMGIAAAFDAVPGGSFEIAVLSGHTARGSFVELDPPNRVVMSWGWDPDGSEPAPVPPGSSTIEIDLEPEGSGTRLRFRHGGFPTPEAAGRHAEGWDHYLPRLAIAAAGGDPGRDAWLDGTM